MAAYPLAAYSPGWDHVTIADNRERADYLHKRVHHLHLRWPEALRTPTVSQRESRQLTFDPLYGGRMRVLSAEAGAVGVGQSPDSFHASECHLWSDFEGSMFLLTPALRNRKNALVTFEATPWERGSAWHEHYLMAKEQTPSQDGRHFAKFYPFWDGHLNARTPPQDTVWDNEEIGLYNRYHAEGLDWSNLYFRRLALQEDAELRRHPGRFVVMYPFDDVACWISSSNAAIPNRALERHIHQNMTEWVAPYMEYEAPKGDAIYAIGVDPSGYAARDHASFHVLKVYDGQWEQVATFADHIDPLAFHREILKAARRYNNALVVVESNGVGQAVLSLLDQAEYGNLYYEKKFNPGLTTTSKSLDRMTGHLVDALLDELILHDKNTVEQLQTYKNDKRIEEGANMELTRGAASPRRRDRHHWDKVSALLMAIQAARALPQRPFPHEPTDAPALFSNMSANDQNKYRVKVKEDSNAREERARPAYRLPRRNR
tara:strand:- start:4993 stop:6456 length:1464 start_codon:yes stop_codon:yes gene_type:complete